MTENNNMNTDNANPSEEKRYHGENTGSAGNCGTAPDNGNPFRGNTYGSNPFGGNPYGSNPYGSNPYGSNPYGSNPYGNNSCGGNFCGRNPYADSSCNTNPYNNAPRQGNPYAGGMYNGNAPYYGNPYYGNPYAYAPLRKKSFSERFNNYFRKKPYSGIAALAGFASLGIILYLGLSSVLGGLITVLSVINPDLFSDSYVFSLLGMLSSVLCVGLPFIIVYMVMNRYEKTAYRIPFNRPRKGSYWGLLIIAGLGFCYLGNVITGYITAIFQSFGIDFASAEISDSLTTGTETPLSFIFSLIYVAVCPAIFEEIAFRGVILQPLRKYGDWFAIIVSSVIFGLVHGNMTQLPFAIITGIALGYTFIVTDSIVPSMIIHFLNNALALVYTTVLSVMPESTALLFSAVCVYGLIAIGFVAFFAYTRANRYYRRLRKGDYPEISTRRKTGTYFLMPSMLIAVVVLMGYIFSDMIFGAFLY